ncbi:MAG: primosome assembly protein PriA [Sphingomonadales bacterium 28-64-96]|nr:MAG: primosome assembly protein PriA [Sphingomonadales bacterium 28-64-96]
MTAPGNPFQLPVERRAAVLEVRTSGRRLVGHAAVFDTPTTIGNFRERVAPGAFRATLARGQDVLALVDHDPGRLLGRTGNRTLRLAEDARGLAFELDLPETSLGADILALASRGDLGGMSFGFKVAPGGERWQGAERTLIGVELREISIIQAMPAYEGTEISVRTSAGLAERERRQRALKLAEASAWRA